MAHEAGPGEIKWGPPRFGAGHERPGGETDASSINNRFSPSPRPSSL